MSENASAPARGTLSTRPGNSRQLLQRKQLDRAKQDKPIGDALEDAFPPVVASVASDPADQQPQSSAGAEAAPSSALPAVTPALPAPAPAWSTDDESAFQAMAARRKGNGFQRRGKDVSGQLLCAGDVKPNDGTVMAALVGIVAERGTVARGELIDLMAAAAWQNPKAAASATDRGWCTGYIAGAIRDGWLVLAQGAASGAAAVA